MLLCVNWSYWACYALLSKPRSQFNKSVAFPSWPCMFYGAIVNCFLIFKHERFQAWPQLNQQLLFQHLNSLIIGPHAQMEAIKQSASTGCIALFLSSFLFLYKPMLYCEAISGITVTFVPHHNCGKIKGFFLSKDFVSSKCGICARKGTLQPLKYIQRQIN